MRALTIIALSFLAPNASSSLFFSSPAAARGRPTGVCGANSYFNVSGPCVRRPVRAASAPAGDAVYSKGSS